MTEQATFEISANSLNLSPCMRKYDYSKLRNLVPLHRGQGIEKGSVVHIMLADYYRGKMEGKLPHMDLIERGVEAGRRAIVDTELDLKETEEVIVKSFREYCIRWQNDTWIPLAVESPFSLILYEDAEIRIVLNGKMDLIVENPAQMVDGVPIKLIVDHKTGSRNRVPIGLTNQFQAYCVAGNTTLAVVNRFGFQKTLPPEKKFVRHVLQFPRKVLEEWKYWAVYRAKMIRAYLLAEVFPPDFTQCDKYGCCEFLEVCQGEPEDRDRKLSIDFRVHERPDLYEVEGEDE